MEAPRNVSGKLTFSRRLMQAAFDYAVEYIHDRKQFGHPVGTFQLMQGKRY
jgi:alkylation response protein AidB-like acyl-CoA dehydrogenase